MTTQSTIIKSNNQFRITFDNYLGYFVDSKNKFGRWVIVGSFKNLGVKNATSSIDQIWARCETSSIQK